MLVGHWELSYETKYEPREKITEQDYPYQGNTSVLVFEIDSLQGFLIHVSGSHCVGAVHNPVQTFCRRSFSCFRQVT
jgi:hypothetical protein